ncbi:MAG: isoamylase [Shewanella psychromarinicola]|jgi:isoamylase
MTTAKDSEPVVDASQHVSLMSRSLMLFHTEFSRSN